MTQKDKDLARKTLEKIKSKGCENARVTLGVSTQSSYSVRNDKLDRLQQANGSSLFIQLYTGSRYGSFSTNRTEESELDKFISEAIEITKVISPDPDRTLPDKNLYFKGEERDFGQFDHNYPNIEPQEKREIAYRCAKEIYNTDPRILSVNCEFGDADERYFIIDSQGFEGVSKQTLFTLSAECSVKGEDDSRPEGWWHESSLFFDKLKSQGVAKEACRRAISRLNPKKLRSGRYNMVLENTVSSRLIAPIISALNGASIQQNNSFLKDKLGKRVFSPMFQLFDTPHKYGAYGSRLFDSEGIATKAINIIENGVVNTFFINTYYSNKLKMAPTSEGPSVPSCSLSESPDMIKESTSLSDILKSTQRGILVTGFNGGNSNSSTGDFSYGVNGFYFENGTILHPVKEMNITGNIVTLWNQIIAIGTDPRDSGRWLIPTLAFESVNFSGI
jgi:PmbA protein